MKLTNIRPLGRHKNTETGREYNIKKGRRVGRSTDLLFYTYRGCRNFISDADFYSDKWVKVQPKGGLVKKPNDKPMNKPRAEWKDITSYSRSDKERIPSVWEYDNGTVQVSVVGRHRHYPDTWVMNCRELGIHTKLFALKSMANTEQAQQVALNIVRQKAHDIAESLNQPEGTTQDQ